MCFINVFLDYLVEFQKLHQLSTEQNNIQYHLDFQLKREPIDVLHNYLQVLQIGEEREQLGQECDIPNID